jgi:UDP-sugar pyrophosphorylase
MGGGFTLSVSPPEGSLPRCTRPRALGSDSPEDTDTEPGPEAIDLEGRSGAPGSGPPDLLDPSGEGRTRHDIGRCNVEVTMESIARAHLERGGLSHDERAWIRALLALGQAHLFSGWAEPGEQTAAKRDMLAALGRADRAYPGGLATYLERARALLRAAREGSNAFEGLRPEQPETIDLSRLDHRYEAYERAGLAAAGGLGVVLVAGGMGERLGYPGIKLDIPVEVTTGTSYLELYAQWVRALGERSGRPVTLVIMTSGQTHQGTVASLERAGWFDMPERIVLLRQELVPALADEQGRIATQGAYEVQLKPHGHGDVHLLLHQSGTARRLADAGVTHLLFIQDTNAQVLNSSLAALGVSLERGLAYNSIAVPRRPGEAVGAITRLVGQDSDLTLNVEYNQLDALLRAAGLPGDVADDSGYSTFPGNINTLVIAMEPYLEVLEASGGVIAEFVNPKYADAERTRFAKPARLETMMQDLPRLFTRSQRVGVTVMDRVWSFSADKNNLASARAKIAQGIAPECAASAEADFYAAARRKLALVGAQLEPPGEARYQGIPVSAGARVFLSPRFALTLSELRERVEGLVLSAGCSLVLDGSDITLDGVELRGASGLSVRACDGAQVLVRDLSLEADGWLVQPFSDAELAEGSVPAALAIRGYRSVAHQPVVVEIDSPGRYLVTGSGVVERLG